MSKLDTATVTAAVVGAALGAAGHPVLQAVVVTAFADLGLGLTKAWLTGVVESGRLGKGLFKILAYLSIGVVLVLIGRVSDASLIAANALAAAFLLRELLSIVENLHVIGRVLGVEIPGVALLVRLLKLNEAKLLAEAGEGQEETP